MSITKAVKALLEDELFVIVLKAMLYTLMVMFGVVVFAGVQAFI